MPPSRIPVIASLQNAAVKLIRSLSRKKVRAETGLFVAEGENMLSRARAQGWVPEMLVATGTVPEWGGARRIEVSRPVMAALSAQTNPPGLLGVFKQKWQSEIATAGLWLALEDMRDPGNLGSIIRTADAAGARGIILAGEACDPWGSDCVRATTGSIFAVPLVQLPGPALIDLCRRWPGEVIGTHLRASEDYRRGYREPALVVMGSEGRGLSEALAAACSSLVRIPMRGGTESLNVAVAAALVLYEVRRSEK